MKISLLLGKLPQDIVNACIDYLYDHDKFKLLFGEDSKFDYNTENTKTEEVYYCDINTVKQMAVKNRLHDLFRWITKKFGISPNDTVLYYIAANDGDLDTIKWLYK